MIARVFSRRGNVAVYTRFNCKFSSNQRGNTLLAALTLVFLIFMVLTVMLGRVAASYTHVTLRNNQTKALFLADAGIQKAAHRLVSDKNYTGERGTRLPTGTFDVAVSRGANGYAVRSTGYADSALKTKPKKSVQAIIRLTGVGGFRIQDWKENP